MKTPIQRSGWTIVGQISDSTPKRLRVNDFFSNACGANSRCGRALTKKNCSGAAPDGCAYGSTAGINLHVESRRQSRALGQKVKMAKSDLKPLPFLKYVPDRDDI
mmetsp:Transcript_37569/g.99993  ORF Transcript_37569/g.99993 Transcript_37569/m.99993 type:complete len:105 (-) Transcript_37569:262-576(-)